VRGSFWSSRKGPANRNIQRSLVEIVSVVLVATGVLLWFQPLQILHDQAGNVVRTGVLVELLLYVFFAVGLTIAGLAFYVYSLHTYRSEDNTSVPDPDLTQLEFFLERPKQMEATQRPQPSIDTRTISEAEPRRFARTYVLAFVEGGIVFALYGMLVSVYDATPSMQDWVAINASWAEYLLNDTTLALLLGVFFGILLSELRAVRRKRWRLLLRMWRTLR
jgi:hypothetical protein